MSRLWLELCSTAVSRLLTVAAEIHYVVAKVGRTRGAIESDSICVISAEWSHTWTHENTHLDLSACLDCLLPGSLVPELGAVS